MALDNTKTCIKAAADKIHGQFGKYYKLYNDEEATALIGEDMSYHPCEEVEGYDLEHMFWAIAKPEYYDALSDNNIAELEYVREPDGNCFLGYAISDRVYSLSQSEVASAIGEDIYSSEYVDASVDASYNFIELPAFKKDAKRLKLTHDDIEELKLNIIDEEPEANLGSNVYKFRWAPKRWNVGQSGALRVIYVDVVKDSNVYLANMYAKNEMDNLDSDDLAYLRRVAKALQKGAN